MTLLALLTPTFGATWSVGPHGDFDSIQEAVDTAADGDSILIQQGDYELVVIDGRDLAIEASPGVTLESIHFLDSTVSFVGLNIAEAMVVEGGTVTGSNTRFVGHGKMSAPALTVVRGEVSLTDTSVSDWDAPGSPIEIFDGGASFDGMDVVRTGGDSGGAMHVYGGTVSVSSSRFSDIRAAGSGGAIAVSDGSLAVSASTFESCSAERGGFLSVHDASASIETSSFEGGFARTGGGAMHLDGGSLTVTSVSFRDNEATGSGGSMAIQRGSFSATDIESDGSIAESGGHIFVGSGASVSITRSVLSAGQAVSGAGLTNDGGSVFVSNAIWKDAEWADVGGAVYMSDGSLEMRYAVLARNKAAVGGGVAMEGGDAHFEGCIIAHNAAEAIANAGSGSATYRHGVTWDNSGVEIAGNVHFGAGAFAADPMFRSPEGGDYALWSYSPALDSGPAGEVDPDLTAPDMGAYGGHLAWALPDEDGDGHVYGRDCDDQDPDSFEYAIDAWYDGIDHDCRRNSDFDMDGDGHDSAIFGGDDCDDSNASRNPSHYEESGDEFDSDCDGLLDRDGDGDGWSDAVDCDDQDPDVHPAAHDAPYDGIDTDCRGDDDYDWDGDGWRLEVDCDDTDPYVHPDAAEVSDDGVDQDCDGSDLDGSAPGYVDTLVASSDDDEVPWAPVSPPSYAVTTGGCSSAQTPTGLAAALLALAGTLLLRRRD